MAPAEGVEAVKLSGRALADKLMQIAAKRLQRLLDELSELRDVVERSERNESEACELATFQSNVLRELPIDRDTNESFPGEAAGASRSIREALEWYVEHDETNDEPGNEFWLEGRRRALEALGRGDEQ